LVGLGRVELPTSPLSGVRSSHLSYRPALSLTSALGLRYGPTRSERRSMPAASPSFSGRSGSNSWWSWSGSNRRPPECKSGALPAELQPHSLKRLWRLKAPEPILENYRGRLDAAVRRKAGPASKSQNSKWRSGTGFGLERLPLTDRRAPY
jgi:hypothetical protein